MHSEVAEQIRKKYAYRRLILTGQIRLSRSAAVRLIGPDCAYHLYSKEEREEASARRPIKGREK